MSNANVVNYYSIRENYAVGINQPSIYENFCETNLIVYPLADDNVINQSILNFAQKKDILVELLFNPYVFFPHSPMNCSLSSHVPCWLLPMLVSCHN